MLKLDECFSIADGTRVILPEAWHTKLMTFGKLSGCPYEFSFLEMLKDNKEKYYVFTPCKNEKGKKVKIALTEYTIKYLFAQEVPDQNIGFSFKQYLPLENSQLLITNVRNPNEVIPTKFVIDVISVELNNESILTLTFKLDNLNGSGFASVVHYSEGSKKSTWKFLLNEDTSYMSDYEKMFADTVIHKMYVLKSAEKLAKYFEENGATEHATLLRERAKKHDDSKITCDDELHALSRIINDKSTLKNVNNQLSPIQKDAIELHWKHNSHHPEHFNTVIDMSKLDIMEMCCDWYARSCQYHTNFLEYVKKAQETRFHFPDWMFSEIWHFCNVLAVEV